MIEESHLKYFQYDLNLKYLSKICKLLDKYLIIQITQIIRNHMNNFDTPKYKTTTNVKYHYFIIND